MRDFTKAQASDVYKGEDGEGERGGEQCYSVKVSQAVGGQRGETKPSLTVSHSAESQGESSPEHSPCGQER